MSCLSWDTVGTASALTLCAEWELCIQNISRREVFSTSFNWNKGRQAFRKTWCFHGKLMTVRNGISYSFPCLRPAHGSGHDPGCTQDWHCGRAQDCSSTSRNNLVYPPRSQLHLTFLLAATFMSVPQAVQKASTRPGENCNSSKTPAKPHVYTHWILNTWAREGKGKGTWVLVCLQRFVLGASGGAASAAEGLVDV